MQTDFFLLYFWRLSMKGKIEVKELADINSGRQTNGNVGPQEGGLWEIG